MTGDGPQDTGPRVVELGPVGAELLAELHARCFADPDVSGPAWNAGAFAELLSLPGCFALVAAAGDAEAPMGLILVRVAADEAEILTIGVLPGSRRSGIARHLVDAALDRTRAAGAVKLFLEVAATNGPARALYAALGFAEIGRRRGYYRLAGRVVDAIIMVRADDDTA